MGFGIRHGSCEAVANADAIDFEGRRHCNAGGQFDEPNTERGTRRSATWYSMGHLANPSSANAAEDRRAAYDLPADITLRV